MDPTAMLLASDAKIKAMIHVAKEEKACEDLLPHLVQAIC